jgi:cytochrome c-type biogenesis protein CcmH
MAVSVYRKIWIAGLLAALAVLGLISGIGLAQDSAPSEPTDDEVNAVAKQLYCPVCENIPLDVCPTQACAQWRDLIRQKLVEGWSEAQIKDYFVEQYGERVLGAPPPRGINWLVYLVPPIAIAAGIFILYRAVRSMQRPAVQAEPVIPVEPPQAGQASDDYIRRLETELKKKN